MCCAALWHGLFMDVVFDQRWNITRRAESGWQRYAFALCLNADEQHVRSSSPPINASPSSQKNERKKPICFGHINISSSNAWRVRACGRTVSSAIYVGAIIHTRICWYYIIRKSTAIHWVKPTFTNPPHVRHGCRSALNGRNLRKLRTAINRYSLTPTKNTNAIQHKPT